ncbi:MAG: hypothetical protein M5U09_19945 [Gammaproteobacteria bacterium]|nr:hypothetical protein [Gammaproteobacteria bacterium]
MNGGGYPGGAVGELQTAWAGYYLPGPRDFQVGIGDRSTAGGRDDVGAVDAVDGIGIEAGAVDLACGDASIPDIRGVHGFIAQHG